MTHLMSSVRRFLVFQLVHYTTTTKPIEQYNTCNKQEIKLQQQIISKDNNYKVQQGNATDRFILFFYFHKYEIKIQFSASF